MNNLKIPISKVDLLSEILVTNVNLNIYSIDTFVNKFKKSKSIRSRLLFYINKSKQCLLHEIQL